MPRRITLLHLSDLQFGRHHRFGPEELLKRLRDDLAVLRGEHGLCPDFVAVTGDLAEWGKKTEFDDAFAFLDGLCRILELGRERVAVVPGNHDVNGKSCASYFLACEADDEELVAPYWPKWKQYVAFFETFYREVPGFTFSQAEPWTLFAMDDLELVVAGLNSTMAESHRDGDHFGRVGEEQLRWFRERLMPYRARGWLRVGAIHHNVVRGAVDDDANLEDIDDLDHFLGPELNLFLHGHTHVDRLAWLRNDVPVLAMGSAGVDATDRPAEVPNQYEIGQLRGDGFGRWARQYEARQKRWIGDNRISEKGDDWKAEHEVAFIDVRWRSTTRVTTTTGARHGTKSTTLDDLCAAARRRRACCDSGEDHGRHGDHDRCARRLRRGAPPQGVHPARKEALPAAGPISSAS